MATTGVGMRIGIRGVWMWATLALAVGPTLHAQTVVWSDNFNNGCAGNCEASTWNGWSMVDNVDGTTGGAHLCKVCISSSLSGCPGKSTL